MFKFLNSKLLDIFKTLKTLQKSIIVVFMAPFKLPSNFKFQFLFSKCIVQSLLLVNLILDYVISSTNMSLGVGFRLGVIE
jgi:hypothetical protein